MKKQSKKKETKKNTYFKLLTDTPKYIYKGTKNKTNFPKFIELCKAEQWTLKLDLPLRLMEAGYSNVISGDGFIYVKGNIPVLLTAHMDTVHKEPVKDFYEYIDENGNHIISSPQGIGGDDRCGIYMILEIIKEFKPSILFCEDEEIGGIGSGKFCKTEFIKDLCDLKYLIELDRANGNDAVFYECDNPEFTDFIINNTGYKEACGSFSDISTLAPSCGVAAVNLSCGYYKAHTLQEEVNVEEMLHTIETVKKLLTVECKQFEYIEADLGGGDEWGYYNYGYGYGGYAKKPSSKSYMYDEVILYVKFIDDNGKEDEVMVDGVKEADAWMNFFFDNPYISYSQVIDHDYDYM